MPDDARKAWRALPRDRIVLQISLDSATPELHDLHRGRGTWARAREGIQRARAQGFRVRLAATVSTDAEAEQFRQFLDEEKIAAEDRVIRRIALRGSANEGVALSRADLVPEVTITSLRVCTGIQSEHRMPICLLRATFFPCPRPSLRSAAPSTAKANTRISWQESLTAHECSPRDQRIPGWLSPVHRISQADLANNWLKNPCWAAACRNSA